MTQTISIELSADLLKELESLSRQQKRPLAETAREAVRRYIAVERFQILRKKTLPLAQAQGILTDEDVFKLVS
jgi:predicted transcriptional regulator